jgi:shikimate dehydrogenase
MTSGERPQRVLLLGYPVSHSISPQVHNACFGALGLPFHYEALAVSPENLPAAILELREERAFGANVTIPHKEAVALLIDDLSEAARAVGAVNTLVARRESGVVRIFGHNTDVGGFLRPLSGFADELRGGPMVMLGAGGAARAAAYALLTSYHPASLTFVARTAARAGALARDLQSASGGTRIEVQSFDRATGAIAEADLIVNATPVGMYPDEALSPLPDPDALASSHIVYDMIYRPRRTRLLTDAALRGARTIDGVEMFYGQAAEAFELWTGRPMPEQVARTAIDRALDG